MDVLKELLFDEFEVVNIEMDSHSAVSLVGTSTFTASAGQTFVQATNQFTYRPGEL